MKSAGLFVAFDGPNGVGKSTLVRAIVERLKVLGHNVHLTKEVTDTKLGRFIREVHKEYCGSTLALLVAADRQNHIERDILPALRTNDFVITDRYVASSLVFQQLDGVKQSFVWKINAEFVRPHLTVIVNASAKTICDRLASRKAFDRFEKTFARTQEIRLFENATSFLRRKGFRIRTFQNENIEISEAAKKLSTALLRLKQMNPAGLS